MIKESELGYKGHNKGGSIGELLSRLKSDASVNIRIVNGWTIATKESGSVIWSFTPNDHLAYPSFVKRETIEKDDRIYIRTSASCSAKKLICDQLVRDFIELNSKAGVNAQRITN